MDDWYDWNDGQTFEPSMDNPYEDPWTSEDFGTVDFLGPAEESQFENFDSALNDGSF